MNEFKFLQKKEFFENIDSEKIASAVKYTKTLQYISTFLHLLLAAITSVYFYHIYSFFGLDFNKGDSESIIVFFALFLFFVSAFSNIITRICLQSLSISSSPFSKNPLWSILSLFTFGLFNLIYLRILYKNIKNFNSVFHYENDCKYKQRHIYIDCLLIIFLIFILASFILSGFFNYNFFVSPNYYFVSLISFVNGLVAPIIYFIFIELLFRLSNNYDQNWNFNCATYVFGLWGAYLSIVVICIIIAKIIYAFRFSKKNSLATKPSDESIQ